MKTIKIKWNSKAFDALWVKHKEANFYFRGVIQNMACYRTKNNKLVVRGEIEYGSALDMIMDLRYLILNLGCPHFTDHSEDVEYTFGE